MEGKVNVFPSKRKFLSKSYWLAMKIVKARFAYIHWICAAPFKGSVLNYNLKLLILLMAYVSPLWVSNI